MKLSMWIVYDWLRDYHPTADIKEGRQTIHGVRYLADDVELSRDYLYIGTREQYIDKWKDNVICVNGTDLITLAAPDLYVVFNEIQKMLEFYNNWETRILQAINERADLKTLLALTTPVLRTGVAVSDYSLKVLGDARYQGREEKQKLRDGYLELTELRNIHEQLQENRSNHHPYVVQTSVDRDLNYNIYSKEDRLICRFISLGGGETEFLKSRIQITESFGKLLNLWFMIHEGEIDHASLFLDVLEGREQDPGVMAIRLEGLGWGSQPQMQAVVLKSCSRDTSNLPFITRYLETSYPGVISMTFQDRYLMVINVNTVQQGTFLEDLKQILNTQKAICGVSSIFTQLNVFPQNYHQACFAVDQGEKETGAVYHCEDFAVEYMQSIFRRALKTDITSPALQVLKKYDRENDTDYYHTLYVYLACERNQTLTAQKLFIHRNSLLYRINRISELLNIDLDDEKERRYLLLSYFIKEDL